MSLALKIKRGFGAIRWVAEVGCAKVLPFKREERPLWFISERGIDARDNGYAFYHYMKDNHPEIRVLYGITEDSPDRKKIDDEDVVPFGSFEHIQALVHADALISTHDYGYTPDMVIFHHLRPFHLFKGVTVFLQHGIIKEYSAWYDAPGCSPDIFITSADQETEFIRKVHHQGKNLRQTGLCRYDTLLEEEPSPSKPEREEASEEPDAKAKSEPRAKSEPGSDSAGVSTGSGLEKGDLGSDFILIMPTWREYIAEDKNVDFTQTHYFKAWNGFLNNPRLLEYLKQTGQKAYFYPHVEMHKYLDKFSKNNSIVYLDAKSADTPYLLRHCSMLVTDFSSVFFDVAYREKPIIFYQFDREEYYSKHYGKGYINNCDFGTVCETEEEAVDAVMHPMTRDCSDFFAFHDTHNCDRVFEEIIKEVNQRKE